MHPQPFSDLVHWLDLHWAQSRPDPCIGSHPCKRGTCDMISPMLNAAQNRQSSLLLSWRSRLHRMDKQSCELRLLSYRNFLNLRIEWWADSPPWFHRRRYNPLVATDSEFMPAMVVRTVPHEKADCNRVLLRSRFLCLDRFLSSASGTIQRSTHELSSLRVIVRLCFQDLVEGLWRAYEMFWKSHGGRLNRQVLRLGSAKISSRSETFVLG